MQEITAADFISPEGKRNPLPLATTLRTKAPLCAFDLPDGIRAWMVSRFDDAVMALRDPRFIKDAATIAQQENHPQEALAHDNVFRLLTRNLLGVDPPDHTRLRSLVAKTFTPRMVELQRTAVERISNTLLDAVQQRGWMDLVRDFAFPLPITVLSNILGLPEEDQEQFRKWTSVQIAGFGIFEAIRNARAEIEAYLDYIKQLIAQKRKHPADDLVSQLVQIEEAGDRLTEQELVSTVNLLVIAGHETTVNLISGGMLALIQHPDQMEQLRANPSLMSAAVEELLRYISPVTVTTFRWAREDVFWYDKHIRQGDAVFISLMAADLDPEQFQQPEQLNITREENRHLAFGKGIHFCLGAPLARLEAQIAFSILLQRLPNLRLAVSPDELSWQPSLLMRGLQALPVTF